MRSARSFRGTRPNGCGPVCRSRTHSGLVRSDSGSPPLGHSLMRKSRGTKSNSGQAPHRPLDLLRAPIPLFRRRLIGALRGGRLLPAGPLWRGLRRDWRDIDAGEERRSPGSAVNSHPPGDSDKGPQRSGCRRTVSGMRRGGWIEPPSAPAEGAEPRDLRSRSPAMAARLNPPMNAERHGDGGREDRQQPEDHFAR